MNFIYIRLLLSPHFSKIIKIIEELERPDICEMLKLEPRNKNFDIIINT